MTDWTERQEVEEQEAELASEEAPSPRVVRSDETRRRPAV